MNINTKKIRNTAMPKNKTAQKNLDFAKTQISQAISNIPEGFTDAKQLQASLNAIKPIIDSIKELNGFIDGKAGAIDTGNRVNTNSGNLNWAPGYQGGYPAGGYAGYGVLATDPKEALNQLKKTGATILNGLGAFSEGATEIVFGAGEKLFDIAGGVIATPVTKIEDAFTKITTGKWGNKTETLWKEINEKLAETSDIEWEHQTSHMRPESEKWEKQVYAPFRYGESGYSGTKMLGSIFGAAYSPYATVPGATAVAVGATGAKLSPFVISTISTGATSTARGTSEYLQTKKANSVEGVKESYQTGKITKEQYKELMKTATPEWNTTENTLKAFRYGSLTGAWEATQFAVGAVALPAYVSSPALRVAINTGLNALDPVVRAKTMSVLDKTSFSKEFQAQGGIKAVTISALVGLGGSAIGELSQYSAIKKENVDKYSAKTKIYAVMNDDGSVTVQTKKPIDTSRPYSSAIVEHSKDMTIEQALESGDFIFSSANISYYEGNAKKNNGQYEVAAPKNSDSGVYGLSIPNNRTNPKQIGYIGDGAIQRARVASITTQVPLKPTTYRFSISGKKYETSMSKSQLIEFEKLPVKKQQEILKSSNEIWESQDQSRGMELNLQFFAHKKKSKSDTKPSKIDTAPSAVGKSKTSDTVDLKPEVIEQRPVTTKVRKIISLEDIKKAHGIIEDKESSRQLNKLLVGVFSNMTTKTQNNIPLNANLYTALKRNLSPEHFKQVEKYIATDGWLGKLTVLEACAINAYTGYSNNIQLYLGTGRIDASLVRSSIKTPTQMKKVVNAIDSALEKGEILKESRVFYRGARLKDLRNWKLPTDLKGLKKWIGKTFRCDQYISTGVTERGSFCSREDFDVEWIFKCEAGKNYGQYVNEISQFNDASNQYEYLIKRGAIIRIDAVEEADGTIQIEATILGFDPQKLPEGKIINNGKKR